MSNRAGAMIGIAGGLLAVIGGIVTYWPHVGWTTPNQHDADYRETIDELKEFRDEWKCDEYDEHLKDLLDDVRNGDDSIDTEREIERVRTKMNALDCQRFDDFG